MLYAVANIAGKQYKIEENQELNVDHLPTKVGQSLDIKDVVLVSKGDTKLIGAEAKKVSIKAKVVAELMAPKVLVFKYKKRKRYRKLTGHRQQMTKLKIEKIEFQAKKVAAPKKSSKEAKK